MRRPTPLLAILLLATACQRPPPAPEGLDDSIRALVADFYKSDGSISADLTGLETWFVEEGQALLDVTPALDELAEFTLQPLEEQHMGQLPVSDQDPALAQGAIGISELGCSWEQAEALVVRGDQDVVFDGEWASYEREFRTSREEFEGAQGELEDHRVVFPLNLTEEEGWASVLERPGSMLDTLSHVGTDDLLVQMEFDIVVQFRHGIYDILDEPTRASVILTYQPEPSESEQDYTLLQNYGMEVFVERDEERTTRMLAVWNQVEGPLLDDDSGLTLRSAISRMQRFATQMTAVCQGDVELPDEL